MPQSYTSVVLSCVLNIWKRKREGHISVLHTPAPYRTSVIEVITPSDEFSPGCFCCESFVVNLTQSLWFTPLASRKASLIADNQKQINCWVAQGPAMSVFLQWAVRSSFHLWGNMRVSYSKNQTICFCIILVKGTQGSPISCLYTYLLGQFNQSLDKDKCSCQLICRLLLQLLI